MTQHSVDSFVLRAFQAAIGDQKLVDQLGAANEVSIEPQDLQDFPLQVRIDLFRPQRNSCATSEHVNEVLIGSESLDALQALFANQEFPKASTHLLGVQLEAKVQTANKVVDDDLAATSMHMSQLCFD